MDETTLLTSTLPSNDDNGEDNNNDDIPIKSEKDHKNTISGKEDSLSLSILPPKQKRKRRPCGESIQRAYKNVTFTPRHEESYSPISPFRFFAASYSVTFSSNDNNTKETSSVSTTALTTMTQQVVHQHVNGLCIVTAGDKLASVSAIESIEFLVQEAASCSVAEKRKRQAKMLKGKMIQDAVSPSTILCQLRCKKSSSSSSSSLSVASGTEDPEQKQDETITLPIFACVWGTIIELNTGLTNHPNTLLEDPLLDGYLAIILPSGKFPPPLLPTPEEEEASLPDDKHPNESLGE